MVSAASGFQSETSLDELPLLDDPDEDDTHLICGCLPALTHCGIYMPTITKVDLVALDERFCANCVAIWNTRGCGRCGCRPGALCRACIKSAAS